MISIIETLEKFGLGLSRDGSVHLSPHTYRWAEAFALEAKRISEVMNSSSFAFHHIGSTAIPDIHAKPILDILIVSPSLKDLDRNKNNFENLGYEYKGESGIPGRRYCALYNSAKTKGYVHIHGFAQGNKEVQKHLLFRDFLCAHPEKAKAYGSLKAGLLEMPSIIRSSYTESKAPFIADILKEAEAWQNRTSHQT